MFVSLFDLFMSLLVSRLEEKKNMKVKVIISLPMILGEMTLISGLDSKRLCL